MVTSYLLRFGTGIIVSLLLGLMIHTSLIPEGRAQVFDGGGIAAGVGIAETEIQGLSQEDPRSLGERVLQIVISFVALLAIIALVIAGIILIGGMGSDQTRERAKKIIMFTLIALLILLFARLIVGYITSNPFA